MTSIQLLKWEKFSCPCPINDSLTKYNRIKVISINAHEFMICIAKTIGQDPKLFQYNINTNKIDKFGIKNNDATWKYGNMGINNKQHLLYIQNQFQIISINMNTNRRDDLMVGLDSNYFFFIDDCFHMINAHDCNIIVSATDNKLSILHNTINNNNNNNNNGLYGGKSIYIPSKQCILLIGGYYDDEISLSNEVWNYKLLTQEWTKINNISFPTIDFAAILTSNEKYIILVGGSTYRDDIQDTKDTNDIYVLDMNDDNQWKMRECKIKSPVSGICDGTKTGGIKSRNDILIMGFVKHCFNLKKFSCMQLPPIYIIKLIESWYSVEMIHLMSFKYKSTDWPHFQHYGMNLNYILSSLY